MGPKSLMGLKYIYISNSTNKTGEMIMGWPYTDLHNFMAKCDIWRFSHFGTTR